MHYLINHTSSTTASRGHYYKAGYYSAPPSHKLRYIFTFSLFLSSLPFRHMLSQSISLSLSHMHFHAHTHIHWYSCSHTHSHLHFGTHAMLTHTLSHTLTYTGSHKYTHTHTHTHTIFSAFRAEDRKEIWEDYQEKIGPEENSFSNIILHFFAVENFSASEKNKIASLFLFWSLFLKNGSHKWITSTLGFWKKSQCRDDGFGIHVWKIN